MIDKRKQYRKKDGNQNHKSNKAKIIAKFDVQDVLSWSNGERSLKIKNKTYLVNMNSSRYKVFRNNRKCVACKLEATVVLLEQHCQPTRGKKAHFEFYGEKDGLYVLMTKDHIIPRSKGGGNNLDNLQTMCMDCNAFKQNTAISLKDIRNRKMKEQPSVQRNQIQEAFECANKLYKGLSRKGSGLPFIFHTTDVTKRLSDWGVRSEIILSAGLLHDGIEDGFKGKGEVISESARIESAKYAIISATNKEILGYVDELTHYPKVCSKQQYMSDRSKKTIQAMVIKISDRICNVLDFYYENDTKDYSIAYFHKASALWKAFEKRKQEVIDTFGIQVCERIEKEIAVTKELIGA